MRYEVELYDHTEHQKVIVYTDGQNEVEAALTAMDKAPEPGILTNIRDIRGFYLKSNLQFIGIKLIELGDTHAVSKSPQRDKQSESKKKARRSTSHRHH